MPCNLTPLKAWFQGEGEREGGEGGREGGGIQS